MTIKRVLEKYLYNSERLFTRTFLGEFLRIKCIFPLYLQMLMIHGQ
jgi:hypothetical protein